MPESESYKQYKGKKAREAWTKKHNEHQQELRDARNREILKGIEKKSNF